MPMPSKTEKLTGLGRRGRLGPAANVTVLEMARQKIENAKEHMMMFV